MFKDTNDGKTRFYCECASTRTYNNGVCETCGGVETPLQTIYEEHEMTPDERIDAALDSVLKASGSGLKNYTMKLALDRMREAMRKVMSDAYIKGSNDNFEAMKMMRHNVKVSGAGIIAEGSLSNAGLENMDKQYYGWAIRLPYDDAMAGVLFWTSPPPHCAAIRTAVFETRREAREAKKRCPAGSKVVHVKVTISETAMSSNVELTGA